MRRVHRPRSFNLFEELEDDPDLGPEPSSVVFRYPSRYARWAGVGLVFPCLLWIVGVLLFARSQSKEANSRIDWLAIYAFVILFALPALVAILAFLGNLWVRRSVIIDPLERTLSVTTRRPFRAITHYHPLDTAMFVHLTRSPEEEGPATWLVDIELMGDVWISLGIASREEDARKLGRRAAAALGVPLREKPAEQSTAPAP